VLPHTLLGRHAQIFFHNVEIDPEFPGALRELAFAFLLNVWILGGHTLSQAPRERCRKPSNARGADKKIPRLETSLAVVKRAFGEDPKAIIEELNKVLVA